MTSSIRAKIDRARTHLAFLPILLTTAFATGVSAQQQVPTDYVFIIDVSGSMGGASGSADIFPQVKTAINEFLGQITPGSEVVVAPFDGKVREIRRFPIHSNADISSAQTYVNALEANGSNTAIYNSVNGVQGTINVIRAKTGHERTAVFFVYTDGNDNVSRNWDLGSFLQNFSLKRGTRDWLFYTELGLARDPTKERAFNRFDRMRYVQESRGTVHPIVQIETLLPILNFGNLKKHPTATRVEKFAIRGLTTAVSISGEMEFDSLKSQGVLAQILPQSFRPGDSLDLKLSLVNAAALHDGDYRGLFRLTSSDPLVLIVPSEIEISFTYGEDQEVSIEAGQGTTFPIDFGKFQLIHRAQTNYSKAITTRYNSAAVSAGHGIRFSVDESASNPKQLSARLAVFADDSNPLAGSAAQSRQLKFRASIDSTLPPGTYTGALRFEGDGLLFKGAGLTFLPSGAAMLPWRFVVRRAPIPLWVWAVAVAALLLVGWLVVRRLTKPATLSDLKLEVSEPQRQEIDLSARTSMRFGPGQETLPASKTTFSIKAKRAGRHESAMLNVDDGPMFLKKQGTREEAAVIGEEEIFDGDVLHFGEHRARVSSFALVRE